MNKKTKNKLIVSAAILILWSTAMLFVEYIQFLHRIIANKENGHEAKSFYFTRSK